MPGGVKRNKGNKKLAAWDRLIVPSVTFYTPPDIQKEIYIEYPTEPIGITVIPKNVILYEISPTYEGNPKVNIHRIPFSSLVGDWSNEALEKGYELTTEQGETLLIRWNIGLGDKGLIIHMKRANRMFPFYDQDWGHVYGVAIEWETIDGKVKGKSWANRVLGYTETVYENGTEKIVYKPAINNRSPYAIRQDLIIGPPHNKTLKSMGLQLPLRIYPAIGGVGKGILLGFNKNVSDFIRKPLEPYITVDGDFYISPKGNYGIYHHFYESSNVKWQRDDLTKKSISKIIFLEHPPQYIKIDDTRIDSPSINTEYDLNRPTTSENGITNIYLYYGYSTKLSDRPDRYVYEVRLYEWDDQTQTTTKLIACTKVIQDNNQGTRLLESCE